MADAQMKSLGNCDNSSWYWAEPGIFEKPGAYYWNGSENIHAASKISALENRAELLADDIEAPWDCEYPLIFQSAVDAYAAAIRARSTT